MQALELCLSTFTKMKLHELVLERWQEYGDNKAVTFDDGKNKSHITYGEMADLSSKVTACFADHLCPGEVVGLCLKSHHYLPVILLSVMRCDTAFYSMDPDSVDFVSHVLEEIGVRFLILHRDVCKDFVTKVCPGRSLREVAMPGLDVYVMYRIEGVPIRTHGHGLAYCITTSGTTGTPKVVKVPHACIVPNITHLREIFTITQDDLVLLSSPLTFDPSIVEVFMTLSSGACLLIVPEVVKMTPDLLLSAIYNRNRVTVLQITPALLHRFPAKTLPDTLLGDDSALRVMALGGERFPPLSYMKTLMSSHNRTKLFNLYGTTEVSSWATCYQVTQEDFQRENDIPIGTCLKDTCVEVRNMDGHVIAEGEGELHIGGTSRQCFLCRDDEECFDDSRVKMRATGDMVERRTDGQIYYLCRRDRQVKRNGKRINLEEIKLVANSACFIEHCEVILVSIRLVLFAVLDGSKRTTTGAAIGVEEETKAHMAARLPSHSIPDDVVILEHLPITRHGKVDLKRLETIYTDQLCQRRFKIPHSTVDVLTHTWKEHLGVASPVDEDSNFISSGGNSLKALHVLNEIENSLNRQLPDLLDIILQRTFNDVKQYIISKPTAHIFDKPNKDTTPVENIKVNKGDDLSDNFNTMVKHNNFEERYKMNDVETIQLAYKRKGSLNYTDQPKAQKVTNILRRAISKGSNIVTMVSDVAVDVNGEMDADGGIETLVDSELEVADISFHLRENWKYDTGKCVDASPLLAISSDPQGDVVFIGSHSHKVSGIKCTTGEILWEITLPDRVESSACLSLCGQFVVMGCYDGKIYCLKSDSGDLWWSHDTGAEVKSSPAIDRVTGHVYIGSHSQTLYCLDVKGRAMVWEAALQSGSIFSSPAVSYKPHHVYVGTLVGKVFAICATTGAVQWQTSLGRPVFASISVCPAGLCVGCTDNRLYFLNHSGQKMWSFDTKGPIFSSPVIFSITRQSEHKTISEVPAKMEENRKKEFIVFGCHDNSVYGLSLNGELVWRFETDSSVYSTPFVTVIMAKESGFETGDQCVSDTSSTSALSKCHEEVTPDVGQVPVVVFSSSKGSLCLVHAATGAALTTQTLPHEVFSSPVVYNNTVIVGCRDNFVYSYSVESDKE